MQKQTYYSKQRKTLCATATIIAALLHLVPQVHAASSWNPALLVNTEAFQTIDDQDSASDVVVQFGQTLGKTITFERTADRFNFNDDTYISGDLDVFGTASGAKVHAETLLTSSGAISVDGVSYFQSRLRVEGSGSPSAGQGLEFSYATSTGVIIPYDRDASQYKGLRINALKHEFEIQGTDRMVIDYGGNVGIGTSAPTTKLEVTGTMSGADLTVSNLRNCDTIDTDANGVLSCGTDNEGSGGGMSYTEASSYFVNDSGDTMTGALVINQDSNSLSFDIDSEATSAAAVRIDVAGDSDSPHVLFGAGGTFDTNLFRQAANVLRTDDSFWVGGTLSGATLYSASGAIIRNGRLGIGTTGPTSIFDAQSSNSDGTFRTGDNTNSTQLILDRGRGSIGGESAVSINDVLGSLLFRGYDGTDYNTQGAAIAVQVDGTPGSNDMPGRIVFSTTEDDASTVTERMRISNNGNVGIGTSGTPQEKLEVVGTISGSLLKLGNLANSGAILFSSGSTVQATQKGSSGNILISRGNGTPEWKQETSSLVWYLDSGIATGSSQGATVTMPVGFTITSVDLKVKQAPLGASLIVDINEGGSTIFSTRPEIDASTTVEDDNEVFSDTHLAKGSEITIDIDQVGSTSAGSGLTIMLNGIRHY